MADWEAPDKDRSRRRPMAAKSASRHGWYSWRRYWRRYCCSAKSAARWARASASRKAQWALEAFSGAITPFFQYEMDAEQSISVLNETTDLYRFFDVTQQTEYLFDCIEDTISRDLKQELDFLKFFDAAMKSVMGIVYMPNHRASLLIKLIHQNQGKLAKGKRESFAELSDEEVSKIEFAIRAIAQRFQATDPTLES
jgi:hypothetical protein